MHTVRLMLQFMKFRFLAQIEYPGAYAAGIVGQWMVYGVELAMIYLMVWSFGNMAGWIPEEIIFIFSLWLLTYALAATFTFNICRNFDQLVINGAMDEAFTRPVAPFAFLIFANINVGYVSHITLTIAALAFSISRLNHAWSVLQWIWLVVLIIAGSVITGCVMLICELPAMKTRSRSPFGMLFWETRIFTRFPLSIYPQSLQIIFTTVLPLGFINFYPVQFLLGKEDGLWMPYTIWLSPLVAALLVAVTAYFWRSLSKTYESAGT